MRKNEVYQSIQYLKTLLSDHHDSNGQKELASPGKELFALSLVEGWRGEICHCAVTGSDGELIHYKIKDPSFHNWLALALAVRNNEISDFPICNKSFNLSYAGHDL
jgi:Ni,Fe-hydrogenase III large subunit